MGLAPARDADLVPLLGLDLDALDPAVVEQVDAVLEVAPGQLVLEAPAIDLVRGLRRAERRSELDPSGEVAVVARRVEIAETHLVQVVDLQVLLHPDLLAEVVRTQLDGGLTHLEGRLRGATPALLRNEDARLRPRHLYLAAQGQAASPPPRMMTS